MFERVLGSKDSQDPCVAQTCELQSKLLESPLITPIVVCYIIPYITPFKEFRLQLILIRD